MARAPEAALVLGNAGIAEKVSALHEFCVSLLMLCVCACVSSFFFLLRRGYSAPRMRDLRALSSRGHTGRCWNRVSKRPFLAIRAQTCATDPV